jgi:hypothetical protein
VFTYSLDIGGLSLSKPIIWPFDRPRAHCLLLGAHCLWLAGH